MQAIVPAVEDVAKGVVLLLIMIFLPRGLIDPRAFGLRRAAKRREEAEKAAGEAANA
jgi:branched-chain amino acid transport system permease protein